MKINNSEGWLTLSQFQFKKQKAVFENVFEAALKHVTNVEANKHVSSANMTLVSLAQIKQLTKIDTADLLSKLC